MSSNEFIGNDWRNNLSVVVASHTRGARLNPTISQSLSTCDPRRRVLRQEEPIFIERTRRRRLSCRRAGVAMMGITQEVQVMEQDGLSYEVNTVQKFVPEDQADQALHLLIKSSSLERDSQESTSRQTTDASPQEQIIALYDEYRPRLFRYLCSMNLDRSQAEEVIQESFMRLTTQLLQKNDIENAQGWIVRVAHNLAVDLLKTNGRDVAITLENIFALAHRADPALNPEEAYSKKEQIRRMEMALSTFNSQQRLCFHMRVQGFRYKDIGLALGVSEQRAALVLKQVAVRLAATCG